VAKEENFCYQCGVTQFDWDLLEQGKLVLIGEVRENGVNWFNRNPHAWPLGTLIYAQEVNVKPGAETKTDA
jgi:hypothetical protein